MTRAIRLYGSLLSAGVRGQLQYRANFLMWIVTGLVYQLTGFAFIWVVLTRFGSLAGWTLGEVAFLYGVRLLGHGAGLLIFGRVLDLEDYVREAQFDRMLVRPWPPLLQVFTERFNPAPIGDFLGGLGLFLAANAMAGVDWSLPAVVFLVLTVLGAAMVEVGLKLMAGTLVFRFLSARALVRIVDDLFSNFGNYPMRIFGTWQLVLTFLLPVAFLAYLPSTVLLARTDELAIHPVFAYLAPLAGVIVFSLALLFWRSEMRQYKSSGH
jgi:viologen exporter family transport system permease protein